MMAANNIYIKNDDGSYTYLGKKELCMTDDVVVAFWGKLRILHHNANTNDYILYNSLEDLIHQHKSWWNHILPKRYLMKLYKRSANYEC